MMKMAKAKSKKKGTNIKDEKKKDEWEKRKKIIDSVIIINIL